MSSLTKFDNVTALGILARTALFLEDEYNPAASNKLPNELQLRENILKDIRKKLGISPDDSSITALNILGDALDSECNSLIEEVDNAAILQRLADRGELPSDIFEINIGSNIEDFFGKKYDAEKNLIRDTIRLPDSEQHYGQQSGTNDPFLISLFARYFPNKYPNNSFTMLVAGQRDGIVLTVNQAWRIYKDSINLEDVTDLVDMLRRFADKFGAEIDFNGQKGNFFLAVDSPNIPTLNFKIDNTKSKSKKQIAINYYIKNVDAKSKQASLVLAINLNEYRKVLKLHGW